MKIHRFYAPSIKLESQFWFKDKTLLHQWLKVLRFRPGQEIVLFDGQSTDRLYKIIEIEADGVYLEQVTDLVRKTPAKQIYLFWSLLKKDKNDWVLQKATELGVSHFIPLLADRSEKTGFNVERAEKIIIEAAEQCGRSDIPALRQSMHIQKAIDQYKDKVTLFICQQDSMQSDHNFKDIGVFIGPEGGWSDAEKQLFIDQDLKLLNLHDFTLRAETAAIASITKLQ